MRRKKPRTVAELRTTVWNAWAAFVLNHWSAVLDSILVSNTKIINSMCTFSLSKSQPVR